MLITFVMSKFFLMAAIFDFVMAAMTVCIPSVNMSAKYGEINFDVFLLIMSSWIIAP